MTDSFVAAWARVALLLGVVLASELAQAGDLINHDAKRYDIVIKSQGGTVKTSINGNTTKSGLCAAECQITVTGVGSIKLSKSQSAVIKSGSIAYK